MAAEIEIKVKQAQIAPFWHKLPFFLGFPFRFGPLVVLVCLVAASAVAGLVLGPFGMLFRGMLVYLGLRYAFNVLELFSKGRFEGESPDHSLWGPEKRPAKLGLVIALFIVASASLGDYAVQSRIAKDARVQERLVAMYRHDHAGEVAAFERDRREWEQRQAERAARLQAPAKPGEAYAAPADEDEGPAAVRGIAEAEAEEPPPAFGVSREDMLQQYTPRFGDPLWFSLQPAWYWIVVTLLSLLLPSAAVVIALEDSFFRALNPFNALHLLGAMGRAYFVLWVLFLAIAGARQAAFHMGADWPSFLRLPVEMAVVTYLGFVLFAIMGYALYQYHQELHLEVDVDFDEHREAGGAEAIAGAGSARAALAAASPAKDPWERKLQELEAAGNFREAIAEVKDRMRYDRFDVPLNTRLHALYEKLGDRDLVLAHGQQYLSALARAGQGRPAADVLKKLQALDPAYQPQDGDVVLPVATVALRQGEMPLASALLRGFDKRFPQHKDTAPVFVLGARLLSEGGRQHAQAAKILRAVLQRFPEHPVAAEAKVYLQVLEKAMGVAA
ncbi:hypothetical protein H8N03_01545 [Ramlibacter sp. USB13]|uniref:Tetratricopeptide repeat protein n=1 Tax=Ramlibacter cellulosilyticus TaxID=2764187 RepID=A0A923ML39_9BURK|nr:hypothetical protein [Ramlibacter cellulosilyticus]MBC5781607.1 hypothetical protein [Ramlibacter cellulosilyticus]